MAVDGSSVLLIWKFLEIKFFISFTLILTTIDQCKCMIYDTLERKIKCVKISDDFKMFWDEILWNSMLNSHYWQSVYSDCSYGQNIKNNDDVSDENIIWKQ